MKDADVAHDSRLLSYIRLYLQWVETAWWMVELYFCAKAIESAGGKADNKIGEVVAVALR